jgi:hypothetical protein
VVTVASKSQRTHEFRNIGLQTRPYLVSLQDQDHFSREWVLNKDEKELSHRLEFARVK